MTRILNLMLLLCLSQIHLWAQTNVTSLVKNYSFENGLTSWSNDGFQSQNNTAFSLKAGEWYAEKWVSEGNTLPNASLRQTISTTDAGTYTLTVRASHVQQAATSQVCRGAKVFIGNKAVEVNKADTYTVSYTSIGNTFDIGIEVAGATGNWVTADHFMLSYTFDADAVSQALKTQIDEARQLLNSTQGSEDAHTTLQTAIADATACIDSTDAQAIAKASTSLDQATYNYRLSAATADNPIDFTNAITNADFTDGLNGWTSVGFQTQANTAFTLKHGTTYAESWVSRGKRLMGISLTQQISGLPHGRYILRAAAHHIDENSPATPQSGLVITAEAAEQTVTSAQTYELTFVHIEKTLTIGLQADRATGNWAAADNFTLTYIGGYDDGTTEAEVARRINEAKQLMNEHMATSALTPLQTYTTRLEQATPDNIENYAALLRRAITAARKSANAYAALAAATQQAETLLASASWKNGTDDITFAIEDAWALYNTTTATNTALAEQTERIKGAALELRLVNGTGTPPTVTTDTRYARGNNRIFARMSVNGTNVIEEGFCYSTSPMPTIADKRATRWIDSGGRIYVIEDLTPGTIYYIRAYAITSTDNIGYGNVVKAVTLPPSNIHWSYENNGTPEENDRINAAMSGWYEYWSQLTSINGYNPSVRIATGTPTADCGYGGWCRVGANAGFQQQATLTHEMLHGIGVGTHNVWWGGGGLRAGGNRGVWLGERVTNVLTFWNNAYTVLDGDDTHMWPWGFNYASEDPHTEGGYTINALVAQALGEDGLPPSGTTATAYYAFEQDNGRKYYLTNEEPNHGLGTAYLAVNSRGQLQWRTAEAADVIANDSMAWYITFYPQTSMYSLRNAATGRYIVYDGSWHLAAANSDLPQTAYHQFMRGRTDAVVRSSQGEMQRRGYWIIHPEAHYDSPCLAAIEDGAIRNEGFDLGNWALTQRWVILNISEISSMIAPTELAGTTITAISVNDEPLADFRPDVHDYIYEVEPESQTVRYRLTYERQTGYTGRVSTSRPANIPGTGTVSATEADGSNTTYNILFVRNYAMHWDADQQTGASAVPTYHGWGPRIGTTWQSANTGDANVYLDPYESTYNGYTDQWGHPFHKRRMLLLQYPSLQTEYYYSLQLQRGAYVMRVLYSWTELVRTPELTIEVRQKSTGKAVTTQTFKPTDTANRQMNEAILTFTTPDDADTTDDYEIVFSQNRAGSTVALSRLIVTDLTDETMPTAITDVEADMQVGRHQVFDVTGRRLADDANRLQPGIYVVDGYKIFVK